MKRLLADQKGQQLVLVALLLPLLVAFVGLVLDVGVVFVQQRRVQTAADAAASAAGAILYPQGRSAAISTARYYATQNGFTDNGTSVRVLVHQPPASGAYAGNSHYIQVAVEQQVAPVFAAIVWNGTFTVQATATAGYTLRALGADLMALKDTTCNGYNSVTMNGNTGRISLTAGVVQVNSPCANALDIGNGDIYAAAGGAIGGGGTENAAINITGPSYSRGPNGVLSPAPTLNAPPIPDPLASLPVPNTAGCVTRTGPVGGRYLPGIYASNFNPNLSYPFDGSSGACNGVFYFRGSLSTNKDTIQIINGMFYFEAGGLTLGGNAEIEGTAPTTGPYAGILVFMARNNYSSFYLHGTPQANCSSDAANTKGIIYLPKGNLELQGTSDACFAGALIAWTINQNGNATTTLVTYPGTLPGAQVTDSLVE